MSATPSPTSTATLIVGASQAGLQIASTLRELGHADPIQLVGAEEHLPYQRPPLSKEFLLGTATRDSLRLRTPQFFEDQDIELVLGTRIAHIDLGGPGGTATATDGRRFPFGRLALAVGGRPRRLAVPGAELEGIHYFRDLDHAEALQTELAGARRLVIVGGGFIGLEAATVARTQGLEVTVVEAAPRLMARGVSAPLSEFFAQEHRARGVEVRLGASVTAFEGQDGRVTSARLADGSHEVADVVLVGVGLVPRTELAEQLGLTCDGGVAIDHAGRTSHPDVVAAGDCAAAPHPDGSETRVRLESVQGAVHQGRAAALTLAGRPPAAPLAPWFWSNQYDLRLQIAGLTAGYDEAVHRPTNKPGSFSYVYYRNGLLLGVDAVNQPADFIAVRRALETGVELPADLVRDPATPLKQLLMRATA